MERTSVENLKEMIRAGRGKIPADKVIKGKGQLVNVMSSEIYPAGYCDLQGYDRSSWRCGSLCWT